MDIKLIALDLDGTTLSGWSITDNTIKTLEAAIRQGVHVVIATGRTFYSLPEDVFRIKGLEYVITSNGAHITNLISGQTIYSNCAKSHTIERISHILEDACQHPIEVFTDGKAYIDEEVFADLQANGSDYMNVTYITKTRKPVPKIYDFLRMHKDNIENINIHFQNMEDKLRFKAILEKEEGITVTSSFVHNIEVGGETTSKATAIAELCNIIGVEESNVMACGDSLNDAAMIMAAGLGVAMGNAEDEVKEIADYITLKNTEDGVAHAVQKFVLSK